MKKIRKQQYFNDSKFNYIKLKAGLFACSCMITLPTVKIAQASSIENIHTTQETVISDNTSSQPVDDGIIDKSENTDQNKDGLETDNGTTDNTIDNTIGNQEGTEVKDDTTNQTDGSAEELKKEPVYKEDNKVIYAVKSCIVYEEPSEESSKLGKMVLYKQYKRVGIGDNGYDQVMFDDEIGYVLSKNISTKKPKVPQDIVDVTDKKYSYSDMKKNLQQLSKYYPDYVSVESIGTTLDNRSLYVAVLGNPDAEDHILIQGSMHAREYINTQLLMGLLEKYLMQYESGKYSGISYKKMFSKVAVHIIPMVNPDGVTLSQYGIKAINDKKLVAALKKMPGSSNFTRWKANANGVDLNRNFPFGFTTKTGVNKKGSMLFPGTKTLSERESKAIVTYTENINGLRTVLSYHSMGNIIYWDYGQTGKLRTECKKLVNLVREQTSYRLVTQSYKTISYGGYSDWVVRKLGIPAVTIETGLLYAPVSHSQFDKIWKQNKNMIPEVIKNILE